MKTTTFFLLLGLAVATGAAHAAGPLIVSDETGTLKPLVWDTSNGPIPVYTDGGGAFTYDFDGVTPFITIERANAMTANGFLQWSQVPTSTFEATIQGTIEDKTGVADVTSDTIGNFINVENGHGFWIIYDTDGSIMENYFGVDKYSVLGISSPEFGDGNGHIIESWSVLNGFAVSASDTGGDGSDDPDVILRNGFEPNARGEQFAGVFTHEIGHSINLSHSQVNGQMAYQSYPGQALYPGVPGCVNPIYNYNYYDTSVARMDPAAIETMFPYIDPYGAGGKEQSSVDLSDDIAAISNLYPTAAYTANTGSISGILRLKDGVTQYSGINVIARNVANPLFDAVSDMTGSATQGQIGPDGRFTINGLTAGQQYVLYIEAITSGGYPTTQQMLVSQGEYWNTAEGTDPLADPACDSTAITAVAAATQSADLTFNGYFDGVQFKPIVSAFLQSMSTDGSRAGGTFGEGRALLWDRDTGVEVLPVWLTSFTGAIDGSGQHMIVQADPDGNGIGGPAIWSDNGALQYLGDLNMDTCGGSSNEGVASAVARDMDRQAQTVVGLAYIDRDGDGNCEGGAVADELVPFVWHAFGGMRELDHDPTQQWTRANVVSGNGRVIVGTSNFSQAWAWVDEGARIDLTTPTGATDVNAVNYDGSVVALDGFDTLTYKNTGVILWNALQGTGPSAFTNIDSLRYCVDVPYVDFFGTNQCDTMTPQEVYDQVGVVPVDVFGSNDAGTVLIGRAGSFFTGLYGAIWIKDVGWMLIPDFLHKQGAVEADNVPIDNPIAISGIGNSIMGGLAGASFSWLIDLSQVYVCENGQSVVTTFPDGLRAKVAGGAAVGRCEFQN
ncbi:MAG TPA: hypothetical protein VFN13_12555 [Rudaea sp.]|nr:hypothetical protein [Rudaea sp.]